MRGTAFDVAVERGSKRTFASALAWPGWSRSARDEEEALEALIAYAPRYAAVMRASRISFRPPKDAASLVVVERSKGDAGTEFGAPSISAKAEAAPVDAGELRRLRSILGATWRAFDAAADAARGRNLRTGPRGGGRSLQKIVAHVFSADASYLRKIAGQPPKVDERDPWAAAEDLRAAVTEALDRSVREGVPARGPRGGKMMTVRYFVRRSAWHVLDHAWEIENRTPGR
ncbi:MAG: DinB family protein [Actinomycetota bacterium]